MNGYSRLALIGALVALLAFALAAILLVTGGESLQRLALYFGLLGVSVPAVLSLLKADQSAAQTNRTSGIAEALNGSFEHRVRAAVRDVRDEPTTSTAAQDALPTGPDSRTPAAFRDDKTTPA